jgi:hypothetical protein
MTGAATTEYAKDEETKPGTPFTVVRCLRCIESRKVHAWSVEPMIREATSSCVGLGEDAEVGHVLKLVGLGVPGLEVGKVSNPLFGRGAVCEKLSFVNGGIVGGVVVKHGGQILPLSRLILVFSSVAKF